MKEKIESSQTPSTEAMETGPRQKTRRGLRLAVVMTLMLEAGIGGFVAKEKADEWGYINKQLSVATKEMEPLTVMGPKIRKMFGKNPGPWMRAEKEIPQARKVRWEGQREEYKWYKPVSVRQPKLVETVPLRGEKEQTSVSGLKGQRREGKNLYEESLTSEKVREIIKTFPRRWVDTKVDHITQEKIGEEKLSGYALGKEWHVTAMNARAASGKRDIVFNVPEAAKLSMNEIIMESLPHEIAHSNDWERDTEMSLEERMKLLLSVGRRLESNDRYKSSYVESINMNNELDKPAENYKKAGEYFAEICVQYFRDPGQLHVDDFRIVDSQAKKNDPGFDPVEAGDKRVALYSSARSSEVAASAQKTK